MNVAAVYKRCMCERGAQSSGALCARGTNCVLGKGCSASACRGRGVPRHGVPSLSAPSLTLAFSASMDLPSRWSSRA